MLRIDRISGMCDETNKSVTYRYKDMERPSPEGR